MADDEEDDYMTMTFGEDEATSKRGRGKAETSLQRRMRLERQGRERGRTLSKAELAKAAEAEREAALSRPLFGASKDERGPPDASSSSSSTTATSKWPAAPPPAVAQPPKPVNKGLAMMAKMGFVAGQTLGRKREAGSGSSPAAGDGSGEGGQVPEDRPMTEPIRIQVKRDRAGIGAAEEKNARQETEKEDGRQEGGPDAKRLRLDDMDPLAYRDRLRQEREASRLERQIHAAQVVAERIARGEDEYDDNSNSHEKDGEEGVPIKDVNVLWRGMVKERRAKEHDRAQRIRAQKLLDARLHNMGKDTATAYTTAEEDADDDEEDGDDRITHGKGPSKASFLAGGLRGSIATGEGEEDEDNDDGQGRDEELDEFNALEPKERLQQVVDWMRQNRRYCFWCKYTYPDNDLEGCPGPAEEDHD
ncbi:hypothetical protein SCUCBS95973_002418 [Sporothrix curviconia]|uniref:G-patch domain-containing protein n=1 Tax=Sporothrix curviconia TaxID=1260050 RepID=A0ABP0B6X3_9PEZI